MRIALVNGQETEATEGAKGICPDPDCGLEVYARCGPQRVFHWAHYGTCKGDRWWEPETEWHRSWKNKFPRKWQEYRLTDQLTGEIHRADVHTPEGLVLEFQHSRISQEERNKREDFYKDMVWVIDSEFDWNKFKYPLENDDMYCKPLKPGVFCLRYARSYLPNDWQYSKAPVILDFRGTEPISNPEDMRYYLYCLFPVWFGGEAVIAKIAYDTFINNAKNGTWLPRVRKYIRTLSQCKEEWQKKREMQEKMQESRVSEMLRLSGRNGSRGRRF